MPAWVLLLVIAALAASAWLTQFIKRVATGSGVLDVPNHRSSHAVPTPRGGGLAIVVVTTASLVLLALRGAVRLELLYALTGGGFAVALAGLADDRWSLPVAYRLAVQFAAALWALACLGGLPPLQIGSHLVTTGWAGYALGAFGIVWAVNLFNFMDGIDGLAATEAIFAAVTGGLLTLTMSATAGVALAALVFSAACAGFLLFNHPPATIFLGDVGSGYLGYVIVVLALAAAREHPAALWVWLILGGVFFVDATVTLVRRAARGKRVQEAHRTHAYQWLSRRWASHRRVTLAVLFINLLWLFPCALLATHQPRWAAGIVIVAFAPLAVLAVLIGAGRDETAVA